MTLRYIAFLSVIIAAAAAAPLHATVLTIEPDDFAPGSDISHSLPGVTLSTLTLRDYTDAAGDEMYAPVFGPVFSHSVPEDCAESQTCFEGSATGDQVFGFMPGSDASLDGIGWGDIRTFWNCLTGCVAQPSALTGQMPVSPLESVLLINFVEPVASVDVLGFSTGGDPTIVRALNAAGNDVGECYDDSLLPTAFDDCTSKRYVPPGQSPLADPLWGWGEMTLQESTPTISTVMIGGALNVHPIDRIRVETPEPGTLALLVAGMAGLLIGQRRGRRPV